MLQDTNTNGKEIQGQGTVWKPDKIGKQRKKLMTGQKGMGGAKPGEGKRSIEGVRFGRPSNPQASGPTIRNPTLTTVLSISTKRGTIATRRFPLPPNVGRTGVSSGDSVARQRAPVGDPLNNEQWSDHLSNPPSR